MTFPDTFPLDPSQLPRPARDPGARSAGGSSSDGLPEGAPGGSPGADAFASLLGQPIVDADGRVVAYDLTVRDDAGLRTDQPARETSATGALLSVALLDAAGAGLTPPGPLFISLDASGLMGPLAELVTPSIGVAVLGEDLPIDADLLMRVAQLRARGQRFCIHGLKDLADPRWLLAPYAECLRLSGTKIAPDRQEIVVARATAQGLSVIASGVESLDEHRRLRQLGVAQFQGCFISPPVSQSIRRLPGCDAAVLTRVRRLLADRASTQTLAIAAATDPALVMRLVLLHRQYVSHAPEATDLAGLLSALGTDLLNSWVSVLLDTACDARGRPWAQSVRAQVEQYRQRLYRKRVQGDEDIEAALWHFQRRLCEPRHHAKTLRHPA